MAVNDFTDETESQVKFNSVDREFVTVDANGLFFVSFVILIDARVTLGLKNSRAAAGEGNAVSRLKPESTEFLFFVRNKTCRNLNAPIRTNHPPMKLSINASCLSTTFGREM